MNIVKKTIKTFFIFSFIFCLPLCPMKRANESLEDKNPRNSKEQKILHIEAAAAEYGNKTANLMTLKKLVNSGRFQRTLDACGCNQFSVMVPEFCGISGKEIIKAFSNCGIHIPGFWQNITGRQNIPTLFQDRSVLAQFIAHSDQLAQLIENIPFIIHPSALYRQLGTEINAFVQHAHNNNWRLMVRSTGNEDSSEFSNAGGNHSEPNVIPEPNAISSALRKVVASYFKPKSLRQREMAGDSGITAIPLVPVLLQRMIGEPLGGTKNTHEVLVGCVVYTQEAHGDTPGIVSIIASYGHNQGVVDNTAPTDSYYIDENRHIHSLIAVKTHRIIPVEKEGIFSLDEKQNPEELQKRATLDDTTIQAITSVAHVIHNAYNKPMDIELIYEPSTKTIYLVQARALESKKTEKIPCYLSQLNSFKKEDIISGKTVKCSGTLHKITSKEQILIASTLNEALALYSSLENQDKVKIVIVKGNAELNSHAGTILRAAGKDLFVADNFETIKKWLSHSSLELVADLQREIIININNYANYQQKSLTKLHQEELINIGWFKHPISQRVTVIPCEAFSGPHLDDEKNSLCSLRELIEIIKEGDSKSAQQALHTLMSRIHEIIFELTSPKPEISELEREPDSFLGSSDAPDHTSHIEKHTAEKFQHLYNCMTHLEQEILYTLELPARNIRRLYAINFLEALLFQQEHQNVIDSYSYETILKTYETYEQFINTKLIGKFPEEIVTAIADDINVLRLALNGCKAIFNDNLEQQWISFVGSIALTKDSPKTTCPSDCQFQEIDISSKETLHQWCDYLSNVTKKELLTLFDQVEGLGIMTPFLNTVFAYYKTMDLGNKELLEKLNKDFENSHSFLEQLSKIKEFMDSFDITQWENPQSFNTLFSTFNKNLCSYFFSDDFSTIFQHDSSICARMAGLSAMEQFISLVDNSIKQLKGSSQYHAISEKIANFKTMVQAYYNLLKAWLPLTYSMADKEEQTKADIMQKAEETLNAISDMNDTNQLIESARFDARQTALGNPGDFDRYIPKTLEDLFTFIHQSLININSSLTFEMLNKIDIPLPEWVNIIKQNVQEMKFKGSWNPEFGSAEDDESVACYEGYLSGIQINGDSICLTYNFPLRTHSVQAYVKYKKNSDTVHFQVVHYGDNEFNRWTRISDYIELMSHLLTVPLTKNEAIKKTVTFEWQLSNNMPDELIKQVINSTRETVRIGFATDELPLIEREAFKTTERIANSLSKMSDLHLDKIKTYISETIIKLSLEKDRVHWLLPYLSFPEAPELRLPLFDLLNKLHVRLHSNHDFSLASQLFAYKLEHDPRENIDDIYPVDATIGPHYYDLTILNYRTDIPEEQQTPYKNYYDSMIVAMLIIYNKTFDLQHEFGELTSQDSLTLFNALCRYITLQQEEDTEDGIEIYHFNINEENMVAKQSNKDYDRICEAAKNKYFQELLHKINFEELETIPEHIILFFNDLIASPLNLNEAPYAPLYLEKIKSAAFSELKKSNNTQNLIIKLFQKNLAFDELFEFLRNTAETKNEEAIPLCDVTVSNLLISMQKHHRFNNLVEQLYNFAFEYLQHPHELEQKLSLYIFEKLLEHAADSLTSEMINKINNAACKNITNPNDIIKYGAFNILHRNIISFLSQSKEIVFDAALNATNSDMPKIKSIGLCLFNNLIISHYDYCYTYALNATLDALDKNICITPCYRILNNPFFNYLPSENQKSRMLVVAKKYSLDPSQLENHSKIAIALMLYRKLINLDYLPCYLGAFDFSSRVFLNDLSYKDYSQDDFPIGNHAFNILIDLSKENIENTKIYQTALDAFNKSNSRIKAYGASLINTLCNLNYHPALSKASDMIASALWKDSLYPLYETLQAKRITIQHSPSALISPQQLSAGFPLTSGLILPPTLPSLTR